MFTDQPSVAQDKIYSHVYFVAHHSKQNDSNISKPLHFITDGL